MEKAFQTGTIGSTLGQIAAMLGGTLEGPSDLVVDRLAAAETPDPAGLAFAEKRKYVDQAKASGVGALLLPPDLDSQGIPAIRVPNPRLAFFMLLTKSDRPYPLNAGIHETAIIDPAASVDEGASVGPYVVIGPNAVVERGAAIHAFAFIGEFCTVRADAVVLPHVVLLRNVELGARSVIFPGTVLGGEGFGFVWDGSKHVKIPQIGRLTIGADCEIGALCTVDRATSGATTIGAGSKIDNLVHVAHNVRIGANNILAACSAVAGSSTLGDRVTLGGQTGVSDHITICDDVILGGRAGASSNITEPGVYFDHPAVPAGIGRRNMILRNNLYKLADRISALEAKLKALEEKGP